MSKKKKESVKNENQVVKKVPIQTLKNEVKRHENKLKALKVL